MKIIVCMKQVPAGTKVDIDPETGAMKRMSGDTAQVGPSIAEHLTIPHAAWVALPFRCSSSYRTASAQRF
ncbi:hypothetical protein [Fusicatenibacter saccharivorans]|uniref:hypothetical protein n=1 Tax=Fusicatenibacter saccharivorans TaxID=1150298 RepID=UPI003F9252EA